MSGYIELLNTYREGLYPKSLVETEQAAFALMRTGETDVLVVAGEEGVLSQFEGNVRGDVKVCPLDHENRLALNRFLSYTKPRAAGRAGISIGFGDRLGCTSCAHLSAIEGRNVFPILAQQSKRELTLTNRTYEDVLDAAAWSVFKAGWKTGYGADGDHLKTVEDIKYALDCGYSMITLDCSDVLREVKGQEAAAAYLELPDERRKELEKTYLENSFSELGLIFTEEALQEIAVCFLPAVDLVVNVYQTQIETRPRNIDLEISLDETSFTTSPEAHFFVANEVRKAGVFVNSMAPRFVGEFQKAVDYIGDLDAFREDFARHVKIANFFGYKISVHSGSDKFSVFSAVGELSEGRFHLKTSGTSWLEALRVIVQEDPDFFRMMYRNALAHFEEASSYYVVHCNPGRIRPLDSLTDAQLPEYLEENDARQLLHITYGYQLTDLEINPRFFSDMKKFEREYEEVIGKHFTKHIDLLKEKI